MTSELEISEFSRKLKDLTVEGSATFKGSFWAIFTVNFSDKPFYDRISKNSFRISKNSNINLLPFMIEGDFKKNGHKTDVTYEVIPLKFGYYWINGLPVLINVVGLIFLGLNLEKIIEHGMTNELLFVIVYCEMICLFAIFGLRFQKKRFEKKFLSNMKINCSCR